MSEKTEVSLIKIDAEKDTKPRKFPIEQANKLLSLPKTAWKLDDKNFEWNGNEIAKKSK